MKAACVLFVAALAGLAAAQGGHYKPYSLSTDFREVANRAHFMDEIHMAPDTLAKLRRNLFVVTPGTNWQMDPVYGANDYLNLPSLVTVDTVLHLYHVFYDASLRRMESSVLDIKLHRMAKNLLAHSIAQWQRASGDMKVAAAKNVAYFLVAAKLLGLGVPSGLPAGAEQLADQELALVNAAEGMESSPIFGVKVDYTMFIVRGHYTRTPQLQTYFKAMSWYGMSFPLADDQNQPMPATIRQAILAAEAASLPAIQTDWAAIYEPTNVFIGSSNMYTPAEVVAAAQSTAGLAQPDSSRFSDFVNRMQALRPPAIVSQMRKTGMNQAAEFRLMGRRFIPDTLVMQKLTNDDRPMTTGLDVMATLGSTAAEHILDASPLTFNPKPWPPYVTVRNEMRAYFAGQSEATWSSNLYWRWLDILRTYMTPSSKGAPSFMRNEAWQDKCLNTALGSWTELRHDTILYGEQSAAEMGGGDEIPPFVPQFVEPATATYSKLLALIQATKAQLSRLGLINSKETPGTDFQTFGDLVGFLLQISKKEMAGERLSRAEHLRIRNIDGDLDTMVISMLKYGANAQELTEDDMKMGLVADVHTAHDMALEEAIGFGNEIIAVVPIEGKLWLARGEVFSYYEFAVPISQRMTDEAWKKLVDDGKTPAIPAWTASFYSPHPAKQKE